MQEIVALLLAGDVQARVVPNADGATECIEVRQEDDSKRIVWGNEGKVWAWTAVATDGNIQTGQTDLASDSSPEDVAKTIATTDLDATALYDASTKVETVEA